MLNKEILFCGDTYFKNKVILPRLNSRLILNLEAPITNSKNPINNKVNLKISEESFLETFSKNPPYAVNLSNNHIFDYGIEGFNNTLNILNRLNIAYFGITSSKQNSPLTIEKKVGVFSYCCKATNPILNIEDYFIHEINLEKIKNDIKLYRKKFNYIILQFHWGDEEVFYPKPYDIKVARKCIKYGADLIIGHHSHVIQSSEVYRGKNIYYGIGNFIFDDLDEPSYFDGKDYMSTYKKTQFKSNRKSIAISLKENYIITSKCYIYDNRLRKINKLNSNIKFFNYITMSDFFYKILKSFSLRIRMIKMFIKNPEKLSFKRIKLFFGI